MAKFHTSNIQKIHFTEDGFFSHTTSQPSGKWGDDEQVQAEYTILVNWRMSHIY